MIVIRYLTEGALPIENNPAVDVEPQELALRKVTAAWGKGAFLKTYGIPDKPHISHVQTVWERIHSRRRGQIQHRR